MEFRGVWHCVSRPSLTRRQEPNSSEQAVAHAPVNSHSTHEADETSTSTRCQEKEKTAEESDLSLRDPYRERTATCLP